MTMLVMMTMTMGDDDDGVIVDDDHLGPFDDEDDDDEEEDDDDNDVGDDATILPRTVTRVETRMKDREEGAGRAKARKGCSDTRCTLGSGVGEVWGQRDSRILKRGGDVNGAWNGKERMGMFTVKLVSPYGGGRLPCAFERTDSLPVGCGCFTTLLTCSLQFGCLVAQISPLSRPVAPCGRPSSCSLPHRPRACQRWAICD